MADKAKQIDETARIIINNNHLVVFDYVSNYLNDTTWRKEVNDVKMDTAVPAKGTIIREDSFLSRKIPHHTTTLKCIEYEQGKLVISEATPENKFWSKNMRLVEAVPGNCTRVTYRIQFDTGIVKYGLGFSLPKVIIAFYTNFMMKKYLAALKQKLEP